MITGVSKVNKKGQLVIPMGIRRSMNIQPGTKFQWVVNDSGKILLSMATGDLMALKGRIKSNGSSISLQDMDDALMPE